MNLRLQQVSDGVIVAVFVKPGSKQFQLKIEGDELVVLCRETPVKGRVNKELTKELSRIFRKRVDLIGGFTSKRKKVLIKGINMDEAKSILARCVSK